MAKVIELVQSTKKDWMFTKAELRALDIIEEKAKRDGRKLVTKDIARRVRLARVDGDKVRILQPEYKSWTQIEYEKGDLNYILQV